MLVDLSGRVVAVVEFVYMKRYLWIESIVVSADHRGLGLGKQLMHGLILNAKKREKKILLYSLDSVVEYYQSLYGFHLFSGSKPGHIGKFLCLDV